MMINENKPKMNKKLHVCFFFHHDGLCAGYARLNDAFEIDDWLQIKLKFKTTSQDGVILAMGNTG